MNRTMPSPFLLLALACVSSRVPGEAGSRLAKGQLVETVASAIVDCEEVQAFKPRYAATIERWNEQDDKAPDDTRPLVFAGSSSIRRWEDLAASYASYSPLQRGFGGAQLAEVALFADELINRHKPRGLVLFAGTNDVGAGVDPRVVIDRFRCLWERVSTANPNMPVIVIGITPTPSRWSSWAKSEEVNAEVAAMASVTKNLFYADIPSAFLQTGGPPSADLFVSDRLHLTPKGYELWDSVLRPLVESHVEKAPKSESTNHAPGLRVLVDFGISSPGEGEVTPSPDASEQHWNNWHLRSAADEVLPGERHSALLNDAGKATSIELIFTGGFQAGGSSKQELEPPSPDLLGKLAVGSATTDFFYCMDEDRTGGFFFRGLDPKATYRLRLVSGPAYKDLGPTSLSVLGASTSEAMAPASDSADQGDASEDRGSNVKSNDIKGNGVIELAGLIPTAWGQLFVDVKPVAGKIASISLIELAAE